MMSISRRLGRVFSAASVLVALLFVLTAVPVLAAEAIVIAVPPVLDAMPIHVAKEKGFFAREGIDAKLQAVQGGPAALQAVLARAAQFAHAGVVPFVNATANHAALLAIGANAFVTSKTTSMGVFVGKDSNIRNMKDLTGRTLAVNQKGNLESMLIMTSAQSKEGWPPSSLKMIEIPYPHMQQSVTGGRVDAVSPFQPFTLRMAQDPAARLIGYLDSYIPDPGYLISFAIVDAAYAKAQPSVTQAYSRALSAALAFAHENPKQAAAISAKAFNLPEAMVAAGLQSIQRPRSAHDASPLTWRNVVQSMKTLGQLPADYNIDRFIDIKGN
jgi:NitT/TauT family transport system substrate-binding protein